MVVTLTSFLNHLTTHSFGKGLMGKKSRLKSNLETILFPSMRSCISGHHTFLDTAPLYAICIQGVMAWFSSTWLLATCVNCVSFSCTSVMSLYRNAVACSSTLLWRIYSWFNLNNNWIFYRAPFYLIASKGFFSLHLCTRQNNFSTWFIYGWSYDAQYYCYSVATAHIWL